MSDEAPPAKGRSAAVKRRLFTPAFKRKVVAEAARTSYPAVMAKYKLYSAVYNWKNEVGKAPTKADRQSPKKANGAKAPLALGPQREAIVYLRHAERAFDAGKGKRGRLLASLALSTLIGD